MPNNDELTSANAVEQFYASSVAISGFKRIYGPLEVDLARKKSVLVGDNCAGKTTILEAIHLALMGRYRNEPVRRAISPYLFNTKLVSEFIETSGTPDCVLPEIVIEVFLGGGEEQQAQLLSGAVNSKHSRHCGFTFRISPDPTFSDELTQHVRSERIDSLPVEYYEASWYTFSDAPISPIRIPVRSVLINPGGEWHGSTADERAARTLIDALDSKAKLDIAQEVRRSKDNLAGSASIADANRSITGYQVLDGGIAKLAADRGSKDSWVGELTIQSDDVSYAHIGSGSQCMLQTRIALGKDQAVKSSLVLFEEPENHLSFAHLEELMEIVTRAEDKRAVFTTHSSYVANKLDLGNLVLLNASGERGTTCATLETSLEEGTRDFFRKLPGYDTLRLVLVKKAILVEGPSDELVIQRAYMDSHDRRLPLSDGIDVISVAGLSFKRFLDIAKALSKMVAVVTDNDGDPGRVEEKYRAYESDPCIKICFEHVAQPTPVDSNLRWNTLEPELLRSNDLSTLNSVLNKSYKTNEDLIRYMEGNKSDCALAIFSSSISIKYPEYIKSAFEWLAND